MSQEKSGVTAGVAWTVKMGHGIEATIGAKRTYCVAPVDAPALIAALTAATAKPDETGPRWPAPSDIVAFLGRFDKYDIWAHVDDGVVFRWCWGGSTTAVPSYLHKSRDRLTGSGWAGYAHALSLLDAATKAERPREVIGYRVRGPAGKGQHWYSLGPSRFDVTFTKRLGHVFAAHDDAVEERDSWSRETGRRIVRVTRRGPK